MIREGSLLFLCGSEDVFFILRLVFIVIGVFIFRVNVFLFLDLNSVLYRYINYS